MKRNTWLLLIISLAVIGCLSIPTPSDPHPAPCPQPTVIAHPVLPPISFEVCKGFDACFTKAEWKEMVSQLTELKHEAGR